MKAEEWQAVERIYHGVLERVAEERAAFLHEACGGDEELRREVESLLAFEDQAKDFIENPALEVAGELMADEQQSLVAGQSLNHYTILELLGAGGMGEVYLAEDTRLKRRVALKLLPAELTANRDRLRRFEQEAQAASALNHPNILTIYEIGQTESTHFITTEYIEGDTLRLHLSRALKLNEVLDISIQVAGALAAAHKAGIIHRDIKPENIMIRRDGIVKVLDFGLAKLLTEQSSEVDGEAPTRFKTEAGVVMGTASYMSPEQARGLAVDARTDIWSLGAVLYEMVAGCSPFAGSTSSEVLAAILSEQEPQPLARYAREVPAELERITSKALRKNRDERYQTIQDLLLDLKDFKRELELQVQLQRRASPELPGRATTEGSEPAIAETAPAKVTPTVADAAARTTSSASYMVSQIKHHKRSAVIALAIVALSAVAAYFYFNRQPVLTDKDTILLADFVNTTGDAVLDGTLKTALAVQLEQSPYLNLLSDERVREMLRYMERSPDERVTKEIAREVCERQGLKALLAGSVSNLGSHYVIALEAINAHTGDVIARQQEEAESKEQVLRTLGQAATKLREKLGESLSSIQKYDAPIDQTTTSSLEALKAFSAGVELGRKRKFPEALPFLKRAVELDPNFVSAYAALAVNFSNLGEKETARQYATKAFQLRGRASAREKLRIESAYYHFATGELEKAIDALELLKQMYPRDDNPRVNLGYLNSQLGNHERALAESLEALRLNPTVLNTHINIAHGLITAGRYDEAREVLQRAEVLKINPSQFHWVRYRIAFDQGDAAAMQSELEQLRASPGPEFTWISEWTAEANGQLRKAREMTGRLAEIFKQQNQWERAAVETARNVSTDALYGHCGLIRKDAAGALGIARTPESLRSTALALALCGDLGQAQSLAAELAKLLPPTDTLANVIWLPVIRAAIAIHSGNHAKAIELLQVARQYDHADGFSAHYLRGLAYLGQRSGVEAGVEFRYIVDHRSFGSYSPFYPLAHLGLGRAAVLTGDTEKARKAYQDFFALWKDADADLPVLIEAKKEYEKL